MTDLLVGLALVFVVEGLLYALFPQAALNLAEKMRSLPQDQLRMAGYEDVQARMLTGGIATIYTGRKPKR